MEKDANIEALHQNRSTWPSHTLSNTRVSTEHRINQPRKRGVEQAFPTPLDMKIRLNQETMDAFAVHGADSR